MAKPRAPKQEKAPKIEPFFRPFAKIAAKKKVEAAAPAAPPPRPKAPEPPPRSAPLGGDADTFAIFMSGVRALDGGDKATRLPRTENPVDCGGKPTPGAPPEDRPDRVDPDAAARERLRGLVVDGLRFETSDDGERIEGRRLDVDPRDLRRLRRGQFPMDGKLDLHGLAAGEARAAVEAFVKKRATAGDQAIVVVHGKGTHSPRGVGVLRGEIAAWLSQGRAARHVRAFATASSEDGGAGALWVLLAR